MGKIKTCLYEMFKKDLKRVDKKLAEYGIGFKDLPILILQYLDGPGIVFNAFMAVWIIVSIVLIVVCAMPWSDDISKLLENKIYATIFLFIGILLIILMYLVVAHALRKFSKVNTNAIFNNISKNENMRSVYKKEPVKKSL